MEPLKRRLTHLNDHIGVMPIHSTTLRMNSTNIEECSGAKSNSPQRISVKLAIKHQKGSNYATQGLPARHQLIQPGKLMAENVPIQMTERFVVAQGQHQQSNVPSPSSPMMKLRNMGLMLQQSDSSRQILQQHHEQSIVNEVRQVKQTQCRPMSETSNDLREHSITSLEQRLEDELRQPIKKFGGVNSIRMCGRRTRCFMGHRPKALIFTSFMINIPATFFNAAIAPVALWGNPTRNFLPMFGIFLQIMCNVLMIWTSVVDPGILPATYVSWRARNKIDKKYFQIKNKSQRVLYLVN